MKKPFQNLPVKSALSAAVSLGLFGATNAHGQANNVFQPGTSAITPITQPIETGPTLDVVPYVLADGYTINLALIPSDIEFAGYANPTLPQLSSGAVGNLNVVELPTVLPTFTVRQLVTTVNVWDNQTVVLGGLITSSVDSTKDKVPVAGDVPLVGRLFQSQSKQTTKNNLMIFVTATIVDPAGSRVHSDDELPFAQNTVPPQPVGTAPTVSEKTVGIGDLPPHNP
jgi:general secretion pathway protein D